MRTHRGTLVAGAMLGVVALTVGVVLPASGQAPGWWHRPGVGRTLDHVFIIMEENHAQDHVIGDKNMPFLNSLVKQYGQATDYYGVTHTSEPNYIAATSGDNWWVNNDNGWYPTTSNKFGVNHYDHTNIVDELQAAGIPWAAYMEAQPSAGYLPDSWPTTGSPLYVSKHNPFILYNDVRANPARSKNVKPYSDMVKDLNSPRAPRYVWISPDLCTDMHLGVYNTVPGFESQTPCPYPAKSGDPVDEHSKAVADAFIKQAVTTITHSRAWTGNSVIFITADENDYDADSPANGDYLTNAGCCDSPVVPAAAPQIGKEWPGGVYGGGLVPMVVISRTGPRHSTDATAYNHYSMLLTIEQGLGLGKLGFTSDGAQVKPMWPLITRAGIWR